MRWYLPLQMIKEYVTLRKKMIKLFQELLTAIGYHDKKRKKHYQSINKFINLSHIFLPLYLIYENLMNHFISKI